MPSTLTGLGLFVVFLIPGLLHYLQRRRRVPQRALSPLIETATLLAVSLGADLAALGTFAFVRWLAPNATPNPERILTRPASYAYNEIGYLILWGVGLVILSSLLAVLWGRFGGNLRIPRFLTPLVIDASAWYQVFEGGPSGHLVYVACDMEDGAYIAGTLDWYSTELEESADRDFVLASPFSYSMNDMPSDLTGFDQVVLSARNVKRMYVSFVEGEQAQP
jgi:hypothetical protein